MAYFPMFVDLAEKDCLVVGGGEVALRKIEQLVKFSPRLSVIALSFHPEIIELSSRYPIELHERAYVSEDLKGRFLVIGALDDLEEQERIYHSCLERHIHVNCVDSPSWCTFIFPALIVERDICIGINSAGRAPAVSSALRKYLSTMIPEGISELVDKIDVIRHNESPGKARQEKIIRICKAFFRQ